MRKFFTLLAALGMLLSTPAFSTEFSDVSQKHWAHDFVQKVVGAGILSGFPDGTFRGNKTISRFEMAKMISNLIELYGGAGGATLDDLQVDLKALKVELQALKSARVGGTPVTGTFMSRGRMGGLLATGSRAPRMDYRVKTGIDQKLGENATLSMALDTMDVGYNNAATTDLFQNLLDAKATLPWNLGWENPAKVQITFGPGPVLHLEPVGLILDEEKYILRPRTGFSLSTQMAGVNVSGNYFVRGGSRTTGIISTHHAQFAADIDISHWISREGTLLSGTLDYIAQSPANDLLGTVKIKTRLLPKLEAVGELGVTGLSTSGLHLGLDLLADNILGATKTTIGFQIHRVGASYINGADEFDLAGYDYLGRTRRNGTWDLGLKLSQPWGDVWNTDILWNMKTDGSFQSSGPDALSALNAALTYSITPQTRLSFTYERYSRSARGTADLLSATLTYDF